MIAVVFSSQILMTFLKVNLFLRFQYSEECQAQPKIHPSPLQVHVATSSTQLVAMQDSAYNTLVCCFHCSGQSFLTAIL